MNTGRSIKKQRKAVPVILDIQKKSQRQSCNYKIKLVGTFRLL